MVFKNFRFQVVIRVLLLTAAIALLTWCIIDARYLRSVYGGVAVLVLIVELIWYIDRFNRDVRTFMLALVQRDFTTYYNREGKGKTFEDLYATLNSITEVFQRISSEKEIQHRFLEMLVEHVRIGIISFSGDERVHMVNQAFKNLLNKPVITSLKNLDTMDGDLVRTLREIRSGETRLLKVSVSGELLNLSIHAAEFRLETDYYKLISLQDIRTELDAREVEAWQKLMRVLTHEIMNSIAPITSLSRTLHGLLQHHERNLPEEVYGPLNQGLEAINVRGEGLQKFTQSYRKLTRIPQPNLQLCDILKLTERVQHLLSPSLSEKNIHTSINGFPTVLMIDPELIEHVLINIFQNAIEALEGTPNPSIRISLHRGDNFVTLTIADNGPGIDPDTLDKIFIPFFTTKNNGSGIGLALSKQILQSHGAGIKVNSRSGSGTEFVITFRQPEK